MHGEALVRRLVDVNYDGSCTNALEHPGLSKRKAGKEMVLVNGEWANLPVGSYTQWCEACQRWIEVEVTGEETI